MSHINLDLSETINLASEISQQMDESTKALADYHSALDHATFETRDLLLQIQEESAKESQINTKRFIIQTVLSVFALIAAVVAAVAAVISLL